MSDGVSFSGSVPQHYDRKLGPLLFAPYAEDLARRLPMHAQRVLETAAGTGVVTGHLLARLGVDARLVVTDLQDGMLELARAKFGNAPRFEFRQADATSLPVDDRSFEAVVCQFGLMFFPDRLAALREARRVLTHDGVLLLNTWGSLADNPIARTTDEELARVLPHDPPRFMEESFGMHDGEAVTDLLHQAGFTYVRCDVVDCVGESESAHHAATGLLCGSPVVAQLQERGIHDPRTLVDGLAARLTEIGGLAPMRIPMRALVVTAQ
jgi:ubiquinone/menaquinone biosynthesis C-methylase UbiE